MRSFSLIDLVSLVEALRWTVALVVLALAFGTPLALGLAIGRISRSAALRWTMAACIQIIQSVPLLGLLFFFYFGMPVFLGIQVPATVAVTVAYTLYTAAFLGEIWRGGLEAVKLPPTVGFLVQLIKGTSLASILGFVELARAGQVVSAATFQPLLTYALVAAIYFALCLPITLWSRSLEARLDGSR
jgi:polar amino acid transport system permease protein